MCSARSERNAILAKSAASYQAGEWQRIMKGEKFASALWTQSRAEVLAAMDATEWVRAVLRAQQTIKRAEQDAELAAMRAIEWLDRAEGK